MKRSSSTAPTKDLVLFSRLLDSWFKGPFGIRIGLDGIIGLIPVLGDFFTSILSFYLPLRCAMMGYPRVLLLKMIVNLLIEALISLIPLIGNIFDIYWKANLKNLSLIEQYHKNPEATSFKTIVSLILVLMAFLVALFLAVYIPAIIVVELISLVS